MANQRNRAPLFLSLFALLIAAAALIYFLAGGSPPPVDSGEIVKSGDNAAASAPSIANVDSAPASRLAARTERAADNALPKSLPAAYERALSGIYGRIVEPDGRPVANAPVELIGGLLEFITLDIDKLLFESDTYYVDITQQKQNTDKDGRFQFSKIDPRGYYLVGINLGKGRPAIRLVDHTPMPGESVDLGDVTLDPWLTVRGRLIDEMSRPIANARIRVTNIPSIVFQAGIANLQPGTGLLARLGEKNSPRFMWRMPKWTDQIFDKLPTPYSTTNADGTFQIEGAPSGALTLVIDGPNVAASFKGPIPASKGAVKDLGDVNIARGEEVEGVVVDQNDKPVGDSEVIVGIPSPLAADYVAFLRKPVKTDAQGRFLVRGIPRPKAYFLARGPGQVEWSNDDPQELTGDEIKVKIPAPRSILVHVRDSAGRPIAARIAVQRDVEGLSLMPQIETPLIAKPETLGTGDYRIRGLKQGSYITYARADGFAICKEKISIGAEGEPEVTLKCEREFAVETTVLGKENGKPVPLELATVAGAPEGTAAERMGFLAIGSNRTNENGIAWVRALGEGKFNIVATHPAYALGISEVQIPATKATTIQLLVGGEIRGTIVRGGLPPEKPMMVALVPNGQKTIQLPRTSITDLEGKFHFSHLYPGKYKVAAVPRILNDNLTKLNPMEFMRFASENADQDCEVQDEQVTEMVLDLAKGGRKDRSDDGFVRGSAFINGLAAEGDYVSATGSEWVRPKKVEASGSFDLGRVRDGEYTLTITRGGSGMSGVIQGPVVTRNIKVKATEETFVDINIRTGAIKGSVVDESGKPVTGARVRVAPVEGVSGMGGAPIRSDESGNFEVPEIGAGTYRVSATYEDSQAPGVKIDVHDGTTEKVQITLRTGLVVEGIFDAKTPEKANWAWMQFQQKGAEGSDPFGRDAIVDVQLDKKTFRARRLVAGTYNVSLRIFGEGTPVYYKTIELEVPPGGMKSASLRFEEMSAEEAAKMNENPFGTRRRGR